MIKYALITPARNEEAFIEKTVQSVIQQTILPQKWMIVNDGSTDRTGEIIDQYAQSHDFIEHISVSGDQQRNFGSKSKAIGHAYEQLQDLEFDYIGNLDADVSFDPSYYQNILQIMEKNPKLGLAGGIRYDLVDGEFKLYKPSANSVGGPIQLFRRACYDQIGGYQALPYGGIDAVAETSARMYGWQVRSFPEYRIYHYRATGTANRSVWEAKFRAGIRDYSIGYHPLFAIARGIDRLGSRPYGLGGPISVCGYFWAALRRIKKPVSSQFVKYIRTEQMKRLKTMFRKGKDLELQHEM